MTWKEAEGKQLSALPRLKILEISFFKHEREFSHVVFLSVFRYRNRKSCVIKVTPLGDPIEITVRGYEMSIRKADAQMIEIE